MYAHVGRGSSSMNQKDNSNMTFIIHSILADPIKRRLITFIGERGKVRFKDLKNHLKISTGSLYYHLGKLKDYIAKDSSRMYYLTEAGKKVYKCIRNIELDEANSGLLYRLSPLVRVAKVVLLPEWFRSLAEHRMLLVSIAIISLIVGILSANVPAAIPSLSLELSLLSYTKASSSIIPPYISYILSWLATSILAELLSLLFHGEKGGHIELFLLSAVAFLPLSLYPLCYYIVIQQFPMSLMGGKGCMIIVTLIGLLLQVLTLGYLTVAIHASKGIRLEKAFLIVAMIYYISMAYVILFKGSQITLTP